VIRLHASLKEIKDQDIPSLFILLVQVFHIAKWLCSQHCHINFSTWQNCLLCMRL